MNILEKCKSNKQLKNILLLLPIIFAMAVIPLIVRITYYDPKLSSYSWFSSETHMMDMFMYYKNSAMMLLDGVLAVLFVYLLMKRELPKAVIFIPLGIYFILVLLSSLFSVAPHQTWNGFYDMLESAYAVFGYCMICYYGFAVVKTEKQLRILTYACLIGITIVCLIGVSQFLAHDFFMSKLGKDLIFPAKYSGYKDSLALAIGVGVVYATLYNPNYVGIYACIVIPLLLVLTFSLKKKRYIIPLLLLATMMITSLIGSGSKTALISIVPCMVFIAIFFWKKHWKRIIPVFLFYIIVFAALNTYHSSSPLFQNTMNSLTSSYLNNVKYNLTDITLNDDDFSLIYKNHKVNVKYVLGSDNSWSITATDENNKPIKTAFTPTSDGYLLSDSRYDGLVFIFGGDVNMNPGFSVKSDNHSFFVFYSKEQKTYLYTNSFGKYTKLYSSETMDCPAFHIMGGFSGRGYIWSKSLPLLKQTLVIGSGPDTFAFLFPQYDYVSMIQNGWQNILITKPHCMYIQTGIQTGVLSLIAFLVFYVWYFFQSLKLYWNRKLETLTERVGAAICMASLSFMIAGLANDSTIGVSILYWTLLGIGLGCNHMVKSGINTMPDA